MQKHALLIFILLTTHLAACQSTPAPTTTPAKGVYLSGGFNDYAPVPRGSQGARARSAQTLTSPEKTNTLLPSQTVQSPPQDTTDRTLGALKAAPAGSEIEDLKVQQDFDYSSTRDIDLKLFVKNPNNKAYARVPVTIFSPENKETLAQGLSDAEGFLEKQFRVPAHYTQVLVQVSAMGIPNNIVVPLQSSRIEAYFGPETHITYGGL